MLFQLNYFYIFKIHYFFYQVDVYLQHLEGEMSNPGNNNEKRTPLIPTSPRAPYRDFGFQMPPSSVTSENIFSYSSTNSIGDELPGDLSLLSDTLQRLDAEIESDIRSGLIKPKKETVSNLDLLSGAMKRITTLENALKMSNQRAVDAEKELAQLKLITVEQIRLPRRGLPTYHAVFFSI